MALQSQQNSCFHLKVLALNFWKQSCNIECQTCVANAEGKFLISMYTVCTIIIIHYWNVAYIEDITSPRVDMNLIFKYERAKYWVEQENIKFISTSGRVMFCLLYKLTNNDIFDDFPKISNHFAKIPEDFPNFFRRLDELHVWNLHEWNNMLFSCVQI